MPARGHDTHAVLFATAGMRISLYVGQGGDFLSLLHDRRHLMSAFTGRRLAYNEDLDGVPTGLENYQYDEEEMRKTLDFEFGKLDPLNCCILKMRGEEAGTEFAKYDTKNVYHDGEMLSTIQDLYGKKFEALGYSREVPEATGLSFRGFMSKLKKIQETALALDGDEQRRAHEMITDYVERGYAAAGAHGARTVYGACPADRRLYEWIGADERVAVELDMTLTALSDMATFRRRMGSVLMRKTQAATLTSFSTAGGSKDPERAYPKKKTAGDSQTTLAKSVEMPKKIRDRKSDKQPVAGKKRIYPYADGSFSIGA